MSATSVDAGERVSRQCLGGEDTSLWLYVEPLRDARTKLAGFFSILPNRLPLSP
jgi:hypothetical protein